MLPVQDVGISLGFVPLDFQRAIANELIEHLAKIELSKILSTIVRDYDIVQVNPEQQWKWKAYFATLPSDWPVYVRKRLE